MAMYELAMLIDARGLISPRPIDQTIRAFAPLPRDSVAEVLTNDPGMISALLTWARAGRHRLLGMTATNGGVYRFLIQHG